MNFDELVALMRENGIVGAGGAGFPSYAKLSQSVDTIIVNCAECEPLLRLHRQLMEKRAAEILGTLDKIAKTVGAKEVVIALKAVYTKAVAAIEANIAPFKNIRICPLKEVYPAGDEVVLIYEATGRIVPAGALPSSVGITVFNVETVYNIYRAMNGTPVTHKYVTVAGEVKAPQTFYAPIGTSFSELIALAGGETVDNPAYLVGGPMMGRLGSVSDVVTKTTNAVIVLPDDHYVVMRKRTSPSIDLKRAMASCCQCHYCTDMCPRHLLGHPINPAELMRVASNHDTANAKPYLDALYCSGCGLCEMYSCVQGLSARNVIGAIKAGLRTAGVKAPVVSDPVPVENRELRRVPLSRLRARIGLEKYNHSAPMVDTAVCPKEVKIKLSQHVGVPAVASVGVGDNVAIGQVIAKAAEGKLSVNIHSSVNGRVSEVTNAYIKITI
ncbi:MAG: SLBB domain-containing protein [Clostridiales bacterium]|nr:SLBB domain-containing protein [Clostridiales bacterium]